MIDPAAYTASSNGNPTYTVKDRSTPSRKEFMDLLLASVTHQDPMKPLENAELMSQISALETMSQIEDLGKSLDNLTRNQGLTASNLLGRKVVVEGADGALTTGEVESVRLSGSTAELVVAGQTYSLDSLREVLS